MQHLAQYDLIGLLITNKYPLASMTLSLPCLMQNDGEEMTSKLAVIDLVHCSEEATTSFNHRTNSIRRGVSQS